MPIETTVNDQQQLIYSNCIGVMTSEDFKDYIKRILGQREFFGYNELFDATQADWSQFEYGDLLELSNDATKLPTIDPNSKLAWLVLEGKQQKLSDFYMAAESLKTIPSRNLQSFNSKDKALDWLSN